MFSNNGKISERQLYRMIIVSSLGPALLICPRIFGEYGSLGIVAYLVAGLMSALYIIGSFMLKNKATDKPVWDIVKGFFGAIGIIRLLVVAISGLYIMLDVVRRILLPKTNGIMVLLLVGVLLVYWVQSGLECTARAMELLFYWVLVPIVISLTVVIPNVELGNIVDGGGNVAVITGGGMQGGKISDISGMNTIWMIEGIDIFKLIFKTLIVFIIFTPAELIWLTKDGFNCNKIKKPVWKGYTFFWVVNVIAYVIILGIYGAHGLNVDENYPIIKVMQISGVPGDFLRRVDGFVGTYLVVSIFCGIALALAGMKIMIDYLRRMGKNEVNKVTLKDDSGNLIGRLISIGLVTIIILSVSFIYGKSSYKQKEVFAGVELEQRGFVMSIIMLKDSIIFEMANEEDNDWQSSSEYVHLNTTDLKKAERLYKANGEKVLDFSHMKIFFVEKNNKSERIYRKNLEYMYEEERFGENILVCELSGDIKDMTAEAIEGSKALAVKIENILKASGKDKGRELYQVRNELH